MYTGFDEDAERIEIERHWFALHRAAGRLQQECDGIALRLQQTQDMWRDAHSRLSELEALRDALGDELARQDTSPAAYHADLSVGGGKSLNVSRTRRAAIR